jgi:branched-chain amino acid transport system substrate-binding protein
MQESSDLQFPSHVILRWEAFMTRKFLWWLCGVLLLASCTGAKSDSNENEIVIGEFGSLTGTTATFGISTHNGVTMAVEAINNAGGLLGKKVRVIVEDDQGKPEEAQTVVTKLINKDQVIAVIGEVASSRTMAAAPVAQQNGIPLISPSSTNPKVTQIGDYIFRVCFIDPFQGLVMAKFATNTLKVKKVAILRDIKNDYSVGLADVFVENFTKMGGTIVANESYSEGDTDFSAQLTSLKAKGPEAVFVPGYYTEAGLILRQAHKLGLTIPFLGGDGWDSPKLVEIGGEAMNGSYYSNHFSVTDPNPVIQKFVADYKAKYNETPDALAGLGFDTANILFDAIKRANSTDGAKIRDAIASTKDFAGITGNITIDKDRNAVKPAVVLQVKNGNLEYVETITP